MCGNCRKRQVKCEYEETFRETPGLSGESDLSSSDKKEKLVFRIHPLSNIVNGSSSSTAGSSRAVMRRNRATAIPRSSGSLGMPLNQWLDFPLLERELLHHFRTVTAVALTTDARSGLVWEREVPRQTSRFSVLRHIVLSLASLHLAYLEPAMASKHSYHAAFYHARGIKGAMDCAVAIDVQSKVAPGVPSILTDDGFLVLVYTTGLAMVQELASLHPSYFPQARDRDKTKLDEFVDKVVLIRSVMKLWETETGSFDVRVTGVFGSCTKSDPANPAYIEVQSALEGLKMVNRAATLDKQEKYAYEIAIEMLRGCFEVAMADPPDWTSSFMWTNMITDPYVTLLKQRRPLALVILGYFCALVHHYPRAWWARGWPTEVFSSLFSALGREWHVALEWPASAVGYAGYST